MSPNFEIAPFRALRFNPERLPRGPGGAPDLNSLVAPPYDIISPAEHRLLLERSNHNIVRLTLGDRPGEKAAYTERAALLGEWRRDGFLSEEPEAALQVYGAEYGVPGANDRRVSFRGLLALGSLHDFAEKVVHPHEQTFADVVGDRYRLLEATRTHLETIFLLYSDPAGEVDGLLRRSSAGTPEVQVEARPGEFHSLWSIRDKSTLEKLRALFRAQRPIIADGHHRYTTACLYRKRNGQDPARRPGSNWQPMVLANLFGEGLSILATHRLVLLGGREGEALQALEARLDAAPEGKPAAFEVETRQTRRRFNVPVELRRARAAEGGRVAATDYAFLHDVVLGDWLKPLFVRSEGLHGETAAAIQYFKEGTGEREALRQGRGDLLIRMTPVDRREFREVVEGGQVFPHKTTFFYPKLWSGLALWSLSEPPL